MNIVEIKERHKQDDIDMNKISKGQLHADRAYLLSIIEQAEKAIEQLGLMDDPNKIEKFANEALKAIKGDE